MDELGRGHGLDSVWDDHQVSLTRLREAEHWRRLVAARLDLAVAAVADIDDLQASLPTLGPSALRHLLGVPGHDEDRTRLLESSRLVGLRAALAELDAYLETCRRDCAAASRRLSAAVAATQPELTITWG